MTNHHTHHLIQTLRWTVVLVGLAWACLSQAQVAPSASEIAAYRGLHAAAARGDMASLAQLLSAKANTNQRDTYGRTPLHVATFAKQRGAVRALIQAGADTGALENDRYDAVTLSLIHI